MKTIHAIIAYLAAVVLRFFEANTTSDSRNRGAFYSLTTDTASPKGSETKRAFKRVLKGFYSLPYTDYLQPQKGLYRAFAKPWRALSRSVPGLYCNYKIYKTIYFLRKNEVCVSFFDFSGQPFDRGAGAI